MGRIFRWAVVLVILVILISGSVAFYTVFFGGKDLVIPPLREMSVLDAVDEAERIGLEVKIEQVDSSIPAGTVLAQWPEAGTKVRRDKSIILKISRGGNKKAVPDLRGLENTQARKKIQELGFTEGDTVKIHDDSRPAGTVIAQNPAIPAVVDDARKIDLLVSLCPVPKDGRIPVPDIAQRDEAAGKDLLAQSGLKFGGAEYVSTQNTPEGMIMSTKPKAGTMVRLGDSVRIVVATNKRKPEPQKPESQVVAPGSAGRPSETVVVEDPPAQQTPRQVGPAGPVQTVLTPQQQELAGATGLPSASQPAASGQKTGPAPTGTAKIRYQVPPLTKPLGLKIEMVDATGTRHLLGRDVKGGEFISLDAPFVREGVVTIYLGGEFVWQERYK
ncbi:MAG TPA: PASTA domain-containing protein [Aminivibrio sp.]|mgnify:CR=1 FL=1|nr:PASTA domain-containing protein [Aminivibrio sp.]